MMLMINPESWDWMPTTIRMTAGIVRRMVTSGSSSPKPVVFQEETATMLRTMPATAARRPRKMKRSYFRRLFQSISFFGRKP